MYTQIKEETAEAVSTLQAMNELLVGLICFALGYIVCYVGVF